MLTKDELVVDLNVIRDTGEKNKNAVQGFYGRRTATYKRLRDQPTRVMIRSTPVWTKWWWRSTR
jgi:hypothetical protein